MLPFLGDDPDVSWFSSKCVQTILHLYEQYYAKDQAFIFLPILQTQLVINEPVFLVFFNSLQVCFLVDICFLQIVKSTCF